MDGDGMQCVSVVQAKGAMEAECKLYYSIILFSKWGQLSSLEYEIYNLEITNTGGVG